jgi:hypothetical protein
VPFLPVKPWQSTLVFLSTYGAGGRAVENVRARSRLIAMRCDMAMQMKLLYQGSGCLFNFSGVARVNASMIPRAYTAGFNDSHPPLARSHARKRTPCNKLRCCWLHEGGGGREVLVVLGMAPVVVDVHWGLPNPTVDFARNCPMSKPAPPVFLLRLLLHCSEFCFQLVVSGHQIMGLMSCIHRSTTQRLVYPLRCL